MTQFEKLEFSGVEPVFNLEVDADHCYRVGEQGILVHNASANPDISEDPANTATAYTAYDCTDPDFKIEGNVRTIGGQKVLEFIVSAEKPGPGGTTVRGKVRGKEFFEAMWDHFTSAGTTIDVIKGEWTSAVLSSTIKYTTNLDAFNKALAGIATPSAAEQMDAALNKTPTGSYAKNKNYTKVKIVTTDPVGGPPPYKDVIVEFRRP